MDFDFFLNFVIKYWYLWLSLGVLLILLVRHETRGKVGGVQLLNPTQVVEKMNRERALVLDTRSAQAYGEGHIVDAWHLPESELENKVNKLGKQKDKPVIVTCQAGQQCTKVGVQLIKQGFEQVFALKGGMNAWLEAGLPQVKGSKSTGKKKSKSKKQGDSHGRS
jgi:rhodanese-related sulfurtransferase